MLIGSGVGSGYETGPIEWIKVLPYLVVLVTAICGVNVMMVLIAGIILSGIVGLLTGGFDIWGWNASMGLGITNMGELIIVTLLAGGMLEMIRYNGGIDWIILKLTSRIRSTKGAEREYCRTNQLCKSLHRKQYHRFDHGRPNSQRYCRSF